MTEGFTLWFTGLSGAGKTTIAELVRPELERRGRKVEWLDGDEVRDRRLAGTGEAREPEREAAVSSAVGLRVLVPVDVLSHSTP